ncbi:hypothetical protein BG261_05405 [Floricoccus tropicus]|uniref:Bacterial toxin 50 domain-containing protein n=1 Tax=Floricoccus tropicus TaxID=1859473 RepID=A0A1E8GKW7_9LACT|nr:phage minor capsid protein [Floricoccus tropicus]OFI48827.1 hypothetical protein BG261_05405 [Floricoccus tropicus]
MAITQRQLDIRSSYIQDSYMALEDELMKQLIERLTSKTYVELTQDTVLQWQIEKLQQLGMLNLETISDIAKKNINLSEEQLKKLIVDDGYEINSQANQEMANLMNATPVPWTELDQVLNQYFESQWLGLDNHINQTLLTTNYQNSWMVKKYQQVLNDVVAKSLTGFITPQQALKQSIYELVSKGIETDLIDRGGNPWSLERYVRTVLQATTNRVYNDLRLERGKEYGIVTALMSTHMAAREQCSHIQGGWVLLVPTYEAPEEFQYIKSIYDYGFGEPSGTRGINCKHRFYLAVPGVNTNNMPKPPSPEEAQKNAEIVAKQRRLEVSIRDAKKKLKAAELMDDKVNIDRFSNLIRKRQSALRIHIKDNDKLLHRDYIREKIYSGSDRASKDIKLEKFKDKQKYQDIRSILGDRAPKTFDDYRKLRYNDDKEAWNKLKDNVYVTERLNNGTYGNIINPEKQTPHMKSTVMPGKSYFNDDVDVQAIFNKYAGTGIVERSWDGRRLNTEIITANDYIGIAVNEHGSKQTNVFKIHHSKKRTHIVPISKGGL